MVLNTQQAHGGGMAKERVLVVVCKRHRRVLQYGVVGDKTQLLTYPIRICNVIDCHGEIAYAGQIEVG